MKTLYYNGYQASVEFEDSALFVKVLHIDDLLVAQVDRASDAQQALADLIDAYLADCREEGREPTQPFKGSFNVRVGPELHRRAAMRAAEEGVSLNRWIADAMETGLAAVIDDAAPARPDVPKQRRQAGRKAAPAKAENAPVLTASR